MWLDPSTLWLLGKENVVAQLPIEGLGILARDFDFLWSDSRGRSNLLELLARTEDIQEVSDAPAHYLSVGMKR